MKNIHIPSPSDPSSGQSLLQEKIDRLSSQLAGETLEIFNKFPDNFTLHQQTLIDLKQKTTDAAWEIEESRAPASHGDQGELLWSMAIHMPDFDTDSLYQKRASLLSIGIAILLGWLLGGIAATLLGLIGLGGEILRPLAIFGCIWLGEWISTHPGARRILLAALGLGGLARFTSLVVGGVFRFTSISALRQAIFGAARPNFFKSFWLMGGAFLVLILLSKKIAGMDLPAFRESLRRQLAQRINFLYFTLQELEKRDEDLKRLGSREEAVENKRKCPRESCSLATAVMDILPSLESDNRQYLNSELENMGFAQRTETGGADYFIWNSDTHAQMYETIGIVRNGDRCRVLKAPYMVDGKIVRGHAQRAPESR